MSTSTPGRRASSSSVAHSPPPPGFVTTRWSVVLRAGGRDAPQARDALAKLCETYWKRARAQKRGGGQVISLEACDAEARFGRGPVDRLAPETLFEQNWAMALLDTVFGQLQREYENEGRRRLFDELKASLTGDRHSVPYAELAARLHIAENTVKTSVHRLRRRYRELLRAEVAHTVDNQDEVEEELRCLFRALSAS